MNTQQHAGLGALLRAMIGALQWRLLLLWALATLLPAAIVGMPMWKTLGALLDHSVHASAWAQHFNGLAMSDVLVLAGRHDGWLSGAGLLATVLALLLSPWLTGMAINAGRAQRQPGFGELVHDGLRDYWRLFRLWLWALVPLGVALAVGGVLLAAARHYREQAVLESSADHMHLAALIVAGLLFVVAHAMVESARSCMLNDVNLHSATRALGRGIMLVLRRPLKTLLFYVVITAIGLAVAALLVQLRVRVGGAGGGAMLLGFLVTQLIVMVTAWMRIARLFALAAVARATPSRRQASARLATA